MQSIWGGVRSSDCKDGQKTWKKNGHTEQEVSFEKRIRKSKAQPNWDEEYISGNAKYTRMNQ